MKKLKLIALLSLVMVTSVMLSACGPDNPSDPDFTPTIPQTLDGDFLLTISADKTVINKGESIETEITFENLTDKTHQILRHSRLASAYIIDHIMPTTALPDVADVINESAIIKDTTQLSSSIWSNLLKGKHELYAYACFVIVDTETELPTETITLYSNTILVTVK